MQQRFKIASELALDVGTLLLDMRFCDLKTRTKSSTCDLVTEADYRSQTLITNTIESNFPEDSILSEEAFSKQGKSEWQWIIDPLDGTTNYAHGMPVYCVSIAAYKDGEPMIGVIYDPNRRELFEAKRGECACLNDKSSYVSKISSLQVSMLATGFPYDKARDLKDNNVNHFIAFLLNTHAVRRLGSAALDLCYVAAGRLDGYWELKLKPWDMAAGILMVMEAGGMVTGFNNEPFDLYNSHIVASNGLIHQEMLSTIEASL